MFLIFFAVSAPLHAKENFVLVNDGIMPSKEVEKLEEMGRELYKKSGVAVFVAAVSELNSTKPVNLLESIKGGYRDFILLYLSIKPKSVNIFASKNAKNLIDIDQILSPLPWRGTIKPLMSPSISKKDSVKYEAAIFNGYADIVDQVAKSKGVELESSIGSGTKESFRFIRLVFYGILLFFLMQYLYKKFLKPGKKIAR